MTPILQQFISEGREFLQSISEKLMQLERAPNDVELMSDLFRSVHTLKGNSGLFDFPEMSRVLHAAEDLMTVVRDGKLPYSAALADRLLDAMDFVAMLIDEIETETTSGVDHAADSLKFAALLRALFAAPDAPAAAGSPVAIDVPTQVPVDGLDTTTWLEIPADLRAAWLADRNAQPELLWIVYTPEPDCFFKGEDPLHHASQLPDVRWRRIAAAKPWAAMAEFDPYQCNLRFEMVSGCTRAEVQEHFRYVPEQLTIAVISLEDRVEATLATQEPAAREAAAASIIAAQWCVLRGVGSADWSAGRLRAAAATLEACYRGGGHAECLPSIAAALDACLAESTAAPLLAWLGSQFPLGDVAATAVVTAPLSRPTIAPAPRAAGEAVVAAKTLKVDQAKIDHLMSLIGEMVVAKNGLPFLASRAETVYGSRELSREIKSQHAVINRIAAEMQDVIMQVRMTPVSTVFQRFPRLARDISRKLGKQVALVLEGEETEADKNVIEALADPLIHIVRNSLDHGIELPAVRIAAGKPAEGRLVISASQLADRVIIDIRDDGKGIDPAVMKRKAYEKGVIDEATLERISDREAINLVFAPGFSTAEEVSDLSGRGVGMDVVRSAVERANGSVTLESSVGVGTHIRLSLPLSMAVTNVMIVESNHQIFGVPMDMVLETVRVPKTEVRAIKNRQTTILRDRVMPLRSLNEMLSSAAPQRVNEAEEIAALIVQIQGQSLGIVVDDFREVVEIILKPLTGILNGIAGYSGSALLGDGSVLMVLNPKELVSWA